MSAHVYRRFILPLSCIMSFAMAGTAWAHPAFTTRTVRVPILMYHYIRANPGPRDRLGADLSVSPQNFEQQMRWLAANDFHTITLDDLTSAILEGDPLPPRPVVLTFDDGYADLYTTAFPILKRYGFRATSFVITGKVGWPGYLTWPQMLEMQASGLVQFESHTVDHVDMSRVTPAKAQYELTASKMALEQHLNVPVRYFCYPFGRYNPRVEALLAQDGYVAATTTAYGTVHGPEDLLALSRVRVHGVESLQTFAALLTGTGLPSGNDNSRGNGKGKGNSRGNNNGNSRASPDHRPTQHK